MSTRRAELARVTASQSRVSDGVGVRLRLPVEIRGPGVHQPAPTRSCAGRRSAGGDINAASFSAIRLLSGALALAAIHGDVSTTEKIQMTKVGNGASVKPKRGGLVVKAGDRVYIPAGGLRISMDKDGTTSVSASVAVDPWLPDMSANGRTSDETVDAIMRNGFPVSSICGDHVNACQESQSLYELFHHPDVARLKHMAVIDGRQAVGVLDLDKARKYHDSNHVALVDRVYEPLRRDHCLKGDSPLIDYILTANKRPFRLVDIGRKLHAVDVFDL